MTESNSNRSEHAAYVIPDIRDWPIYKLSEDREAFMAEVVHDTVEQILRNKYKGDLSQELARVLYAERNRIKESPWAVDPPDDDSFWKEVRKQLMKFSMDKEDEEEKEVLENNKELVNRIVNRFTREITGSFEVSSYRLARSLLTRLFETMLGTMSFRWFSKYFTGSSNVEDRVKIIGQIEHLRTLATKGTVVLVPTHFSNLDSILIGWSLDRIGMPAFSYGAGLNLYNTKPFGYFMRRLGAYTVDRRKKNSFYLETLKNFSRRSIVRGTHSLFFPGGTRSRSGQLEDKLKMGLLGSVIDAQGNLYEEGKDTKVFVVPLVLNYHFVLEAKGLIEQFLANTGKELYLVEKSPFGGVRNLLKFLWQFFYKSSEIVLNFGKPMDVMGNFVDMEGNSIDQFGTQVDVKEYYLSGGVIKIDRQRNEQYTQRLANKLVERYYAENYVLSSHILAYTAFLIFKKQHPNLDLYGILRLPKDECDFSLEEFKSALNSIHQQLLTMAANDRLHLSYQLIHGTLDDIIRHGLQNLGTFHPKLPLTQSKDGQTIYTEDMHLLYFYHNRLDGYGLRINN